jgi:GNAT superfamily N-acetyltransferase
MVSDRKFSLPPGYSLRTATREDLIRIVYFAAFGHSEIYKTLAIIYLLIVISFKSPLTLLSIIIYLVYALYYFTWYRTWFNFLKKQMIVIYVVEYGNEICGYMRCDTLNDYQFIFSLLVSRKYQNRGIGSSLVLHCINNTQKPVYLTAYGSKLKNFYNRLGFVNIDRLNLPTNLSWFPKHKLGDLMGFRNSL